MTEDPLSGTPTVRTERLGHMGRIRLDRPAKLNAVNLEMAEGVARVLARWRDDPEVKVLLLDSTSPRAFCAGGDLRALSEFISTHQHGVEAAYQALVRTYAIMQQIAAFPTPIVSLLDGIAMGGGIGLGGHVPYRVVTERSVVAMPETSIGFTPDAGGSWILSRMPGYSGLRLALLGERMDGAAALQAGFADYMVPSERLPDLVERLAVQPVAEVFAPFPRQPEAPHLHPHPLDACYNAPDLAQVLRNLEAHGSEAARQDLQNLAQLCPFSLEVTWAGWHRARTLSSLEAAFAQETALVGHLIRRPDFREGVRARLIDRDNAPHWQPASIEQVNPAEVARCFEAF